MRLFDDATLRTLERLSLWAESVRVGVMKGDRRSRRRGASIEFADYRDYTQGDDLRRLDWNVFARLERPFIKLTEEQEDLAVHLLVDTSASMNWPPDEDGAAENKLLYSLRLAGALGTIALTSGDLVQVTLFDAAAQSNWGPFRGRANGWPLLQFLEAQFAARSQAGDATHATALDPALRRYAQRARRPGLLFLLSDLFSPGDVRDGLTALLARGYEVVLLHVFSPDEAAPELAGDLRLIDVETGEAAEVSPDPALLEEYAARLAAWQEELRRFCGPRGIHYASVVTNQPWDALIRGALRQQGVIR
ncbi:MAG: DUF58 domain-containing protein [Candidatus Promineofilum sp.]|jgi:uncharacterized protein (DUF58 family)|nr:DUF58 domain-containing protein [Promineifilum sp.]